MRSLQGDAILAESFRVIDREVGTHAFTELEWPVVRRMIHASGDLELARSVSFSPGAARAGVDALSHGLPIVTDGRMVAAGIQQGLCSRLGVNVHCFLDAAEVEESARQSGQTRSRHAMELAIERVGQGVYVVGTAPTALLALTAAVRAGQVQPALVVALPVGFVGVLESKAEALALPVPVILLHGRKGGSGVAAAAVNALLILAVEESLS